MSISPELQKLYAAPQHDLRYLETLQLSHSEFIHVQGNQDFFLTNDSHQWRLALEDGRSAEFEPIPFEVILPRPDSEGSQELQINMSNVGRETQLALEAAIEKPHELIRAAYRVYLDRPDSVPAMDAINLEITEISADRALVTATASRMDVLNRPFPVRLFTLDEFPGLRR
jgi:hypothetical protein